MPTGVSLFVWLPEERAKWVEMRAKRDRAIRAMFGHHTDRGSQYGDVRDEARDPHIAFDGRIRLLTRAGIQLPDDFTVLQQQLKDFQRNAGTPIRDRIAEAIISGDNSADMDALWALALAESTPNKQLQAEVFEAVRRSVNRRLREIVADHATDYYQQIADLFDKAAKSFTAAAAVVDPELPSDAIVSASDKVRNARVNAETHVRELNSVRPVLRAAAVLAGMF